MTREKFVAVTKARLVLEVIQGKKTVNQIASENNINPIQLTRWKTDAIKNFFQLFLIDTSAVKQQQSYERKIEELYTLIGKLTTELDCLKKI